MPLVANEAASIHPEQARARLETWLREHLAARDLSLGPLTGESGAGFSGDILYTEALYRDGGAERTRRLVVRLEASDWPLILEGGLATQGAMLSALGRYPEIPTAALVGMEEDAGLLGVPFLVMDRVDGRTAPMMPNYNAAGWLVDMPPRGRAAAWGNALGAIGRLNALDWREGFAFLDRPERGSVGLDQYLAWIGEWYAWAVAGRTLPVTDAALEYVTRNRPAVAAVDVLWGDPTPSNVLFAPDGGVRALIDWEMPKLGPGEIDLAWWLYFDLLFSGHFGVPRLPGLPSRDASIAIWEEARGRSARNMAYYDVLAGLKMAIVTIRVTDRHIAAGRLAPENASAANNLQTLHLARLLGMPEPELGADFDAMIASVMGARA